MIAPSEGQGATQSIGKGPTPSVGHGIRQVAVFLGANDPSRQRGAAVGSGVGLSVGCLVGALVTGARVVGDLVGVSVGAQVAGALVGLPVGLPMSATNTVGPGVGGPVAIGPRQQAFSQFGGTMLPFAGHTQMQRNGASAPSGQASRHPSGASNSESAGGHTLAHVSGLDGASVTPSGHKMDSRPPDNSVLVLYRRWDKIAHNH